MQCKLYIKLQIALAWKKPNVKVTYKNKDYISNKHRRSSPLFVYYNDSEEDEAPVDKNPELLR